MFGTRTLTQSQPLSQSPFLADYLRAKGYQSLTEATDRDLGVMLRASGPTDQCANTEILAEARTRGYLMTAEDVTVGSHVRPTAPLAPVVGIVSAVVRGSVTVDWGKDITPGVPGSRYTTYPAAALLDGVLTRA